MISVERSSDVRVRPLSRGGGVGWVQRSSDVLAHQLSSGGEVAGGAGLGWVGGGGWRCGGGGWGWGVESEMCGQARNARCVGVRRMHACLLVWL